MKWVKQTIHYWCDDTRSKHCLGNGICAAILDTGISAHPDFSGRILDFQDFTSSTPSVSLHDDSGHGTHVAGILAGSGQVSSGLYAGIAPDTDLLICKVLDHEGNGNIQTVLKGIDWILKIKDSYPLHLVNISVGGRPTLPPGQKKLLLDAVEHLWDLGLTVVVSSGNYGPRPGTVAVPGTSPKVITVGVPDTLPLFRTGHSSSNYSGRGPTDHCIKKPDVFAPGTGIISCNSRYISSMQSASVRPSLFQRPTFLSSQPYCQDRNFHGNTRRNRCYRLPVFQISRSFKCRSETPASQLLSADPRHRIRLGITPCCKSAKFLNPTGTLFCLRHTIKL